MDTPSSSNNFVVCRVSSRDHVCFSKDTQGTHRDIFKVTDRYGNQSLAEIV